jgi:membrane-associated protease RseP (regulator of RpoE activity)
MKRLIGILTVLILALGIQTSAFAGNVEILNMDKEVVAKTIISDMNAFGLSIINANDNQLSFKGDVNQVMEASSVSKSNQSQEFKITFHLVQSNKNVKVSSNVDSMVWDSYLDELKARFNGRWTFGLVTDPRKDSYFKISSIIPNSSAAKEGLKKGDHIVKINGNSVFDFDQDLNSYLKNIPEKAIVIFEIETGNRKRAVTLTKTFVHGSLEYLQTKH